MVTMFLVLVMFFVYLKSSSLLGKIFFVYVPLCSILCFPILQFHVLYNIRRLVVLAKLEGQQPWLVCDLNRTPVVMAKHGGSSVHFSGISTCGRTSRETVSHPQRPPLPTLHKIFLPVYIIVTNKRLQPLTITWYNSLLLCFSLLKI